MLSNLCFPLVQLFQEHLNSVAHDLITSSLPPSGEKQEKILYAAKLEFSACATDVKTDDVDTPHSAVSLGEPMHEFFTDRQCGTGYSPTHFSRHQASLQAYGDMGYTVAILSSSLADRKENRFCSTVAFELFQCIFNSCFDGKITRMGHFHSFLLNVFMPPDGKAGAMKRSGIAVG
jgi:hypothetical protein